MLPLVRLLSRYTITSSIYISIRLAMGVVYYASPVQSLTKKPPQAHQYLLLPSPCTCVSPLTLL